MEILLWIAVAAGIGAGDRWLKRHHPRLWRKTLLPACLLATALGFFCVSIYGWALWDTWASGAGTDDKIVLTVVIVAAISAFIFFVIAEWRSYLRERRRWREEETL